jgi:hypothetical protein
MIDLALYHRKSEFERTGNPLFVWDMILECRMDGKPFPDWVLDYLEDVAEELVNLRPPKGKLAHQVRDALGFKGKPFEEYKRFVVDRQSRENFDFRWRVFHWINEKLESGVKITSVYRDAAATFLGGKNKWRTIQKLYLEMKSIKNEYRELQ